MCHVCKHCSYLQGAPTVQPGVADLPSLESSADEVEEVADAEQGADGEQASTSGTHAAKQKQKPNQLPYKRKHSAFVPGAAADKALTVSNFITYSHY